MSSTSARLYATDFYGWIHQQAGVLRAGSFAALDLENLIEEIESMGKSHQRALESRLEILLIHLLKWQFQPERRGNSWQFTIEEQRDRIVGHLKKTPSLQSRLPDCMQDAYRYARCGAARKAQPDAALFPSECPWTFDEVISENFWPQMGMSQQA